MLLSPLLPLSSASLVETRRCWGWDSGELAAAAAGGVVDSTAAEAARERPFCVSHTAHTAQGKGSNKGARGQLCESARGGSEASPHAMGHALYAELRVVDSNTQSRANRHLLEATDPPMSFLFQGQRFRKHKHTDHAYARDTSTYVR